MLQLYFLCAARMMIGETIVTRTNVVSPKVRDDSDTTIRDGVGAGVGHRSVTRHLPAKQAPRKFHRLEDFSYFLST